MRRPALLALALVASGGCQPLADPGLRAPEQGQRPVYYGETSPTLYTSLSSGQQNAIVALCTTYDDQCFCSGSLISSRVVLTAAHCIDSPHGLLSAADIEIHVGADSSTPIDVLDAVAVEYKEWTLDPGDDVGVVVLSAAYSGVPTFSIRASSADSMIGHQAQVGGFGMTEDNDFNTVRHWTTMDVEAVDLWGILVDGHGVTGVAPGDSGSPMLYDFGAGPQPVGIASTSEEGWVYTANYTSVPAHAAWIQSIVDAYESPACQGTCGGMACGTDSGCYCGSCARDQECISHQCQEIPAGSGGVCVVYDAWSMECEDDNDCADAERCFVYPDNSASECGEECGPDPCAPGDAASVCFPFPTTNGYAPLCLQTSPEACSDENSYCSTSDDRTGYCLDLYYDGNLICYGLCQTVVTCPEGSGCFWLGAVDCSSVCAGVDCGLRDSCDCGGCPGSQLCVGNVCEACTPVCAGRVCGPDGCGGDCGLCAANEYCGAEGQCVLHPDADGGRPSRRDAGGASPPVTHEVAICGCGQAGPGLGAGWALLLALGWRRRRR